MRACSRAPASARSPTTVHRLVPHELVRPAQRVLHDALLVQHDAFCVDAPWIRPFARSASTSCTNPKVRAARQLPRERRRRDNVAPALRADQRVREVDRDVEREHVGGTGLVHATRRPSTRTGSRRPSTGARPPACSTHAGVQQRVEERAGAPVHDRRLRPVHLDHEVVDLRVPRRRRARAPPCAPRLALAELRAPLASAPRRSPRRRSAAHRGRSRRRKTMPCPAAPGGTSSVQGSPRCSPTPATVVGPAIVRRSSAAAASATRAARRLRVRGSACSRVAPTASTSARARSLEPTCDARELNIAACARSASRCGRAGYPRPRLARRDVAEHAGLRRRSARRAPMVVWPVHARLARDDHAVLRASHEPAIAHLRHDQAQPADAHVVRDVHEVVDLRARADHRVVDAAAVDRRVRADLDVVLDDAAADVRESSRAAPSANT